MKKIAAWTLLLIYLNAAAQPLLPWISDILAHTFNWHDHLEHVHNGHVHSHHVSMEMAAAEHDNDTLPITEHAVSINKDALSAHLIQDLPVFCCISGELYHLPDFAWLFDYLNFVAEILLLPPIVD